MRFSVVIPCFNAERTLDQCLVSVTRAAALHGSAEILLVDNGSADASVEIAAAFPEVTVLHEQRRGPAAARNRGLRCAVGRFVAFTDADCRVAEDWLVRAEDYFDDSDVAAVGGRIDGCKPRNAIQHWMNERGILDQEHALASRPPFVQTANAVYRTAQVRACGGFDEQLRTGEDVDLSIRVTLRGGRLTFAPDVAVEHDHRCTWRGLFHQSRLNASATAYLARKWSCVLPPKSWRTSVWECQDLARAAARAARHVMNSRRDLAFCDFVHRAGRKIGMIQAARATGVWDRW